ncbi:MAG: hypothetical protein OSB62_02375 [Alphaproteobacteria bacterium]|nr:hypothetical protein [Alphaproteobacteria bacterium]
MNNFEWLAPIANLVKDAPPEAILFYGFAAIFSIGILVTIAIIAKS